METWATHLITFLIGTVTGASGKYFADKYTDQRREKENKRKESDSLKKIIVLMPELIDEMKDDFKNPEYLAIRELVVIPSRKVTFNGGGVNRFYYFENEHKNLKGKITILENHGYLKDITPGNAPIYCISEKFWEMIRKI